MALAVLRRRDAWGRLAEMPVEGWMFERAAFPPMPRPTMRAAVVALRTMVCRLLGHDRSWPWRQYGRAGLQCRRCYRVFNDAERLGPAEVEPEED